jgi:hypothetical protein
MYKNLIIIMLLALIVLQYHSMLALKNDNARAYREGYTNSVGGLVECDGVTDQRVIDEYQWAIDHAQAAGDDISGGYVCGE